MTEHGEVVVRVMLDDQKDDLATIKVTVSDTGIGLTKEQQRALFSAFRQADTTTARRFGGTGLGLVISKHLVEQMRGEIGLESEPGQGSTFWFTFRAKVHNKDAAYVPLMINQSCRIAICDANATVRANLRNSLQKRKIEVLEYNDIGALINLLRSSDSSLPHAVILGVNAQKPHYTDITQLCKQNNRRLPIVLHGNPADQTTLAELLDGEQLPLITKPLCQQKAYEVLGSLLESDAFDTEAQSTKSAETAAALTAADLNIIAVDDNPANLKLLCALLEDLNVAVTACDSGMKALHQMEQRNFDLVLMDIQMPVMDGVETARRIRAMEAKEKRTPIIAVTAHALASEKHALLNSGMDDYVTKPINEAQLMHIIHKWTGVNLQAEEELETESADEHPIEEPVDMVLGLKLANNKSDLAEEMLEMLFNSLHKDKDAIRVLLQDEDYETLQEVVHKLHGATRYTGVPFLQEASQALEENLKLEKFEAVKILTNTLLGEVDRVIEWCEQNRNMMAH